ncbi:hypothetical protein EO98_01480 [Methanosarcina sp. 2.H.T.1A.6]|nr:hypothetical protein EO94_10930 [Methanosarcina sp. 2.H.T.1A.3]KKG18824.1 hypothetical protein EO97_19200 [Methanosarcina sp. 2.H.T.1A.15]KKG21068.1 hypothetical protein EO98_01480 [Methanosarcina sp. 2.H.T.1A.6]KKG23814.1 hypothetical protein EO96_07190 [Methanosarcina sp. 2.H.T.1A.8]
MLLYNITTSPRQFLFFVTSPSQLIMPLLIPSFRSFYFIPRIFPIYFLFYDIFSYSKELIRLRFLPLFQRVLLFT